MTDMIETAGTCPVNEKRLLHPGDAMRCSTAERERTAAAIGEATGEGRLPLDEAEERLARSYAARYRHELDALVADLPAPVGCAGWRAVALLAREQASADVARLLGDAGSRRARVAVAAVVAALIAALLVLAVVHGVAGEGPEFPGGRG